MMYARHTELHPALRAGFSVCRNSAAVLPGWEISLVFAGEQRAQSLNMQLRNKDYVPNVLSYAVRKKVGRDHHLPRVAKRQAPSYGFRTRMVGFLFIHGLLHLKGMRHGATMDRYERELPLAIYPYNLFKWHDASRPALISERITRKSWWSKR
jgi:ssRNA-specific RNase YbeY (16S rRNA maturation enzyme)